VQQDWLHAKYNPNLDSEERKAVREEFQATVRDAQGAYSKHIIDHVKDDKDLYKIMTWHKPTPNLKERPKPSGPQFSRASTKKMSSLRTLCKYWTGTSHLPWTSSVTLEEVEWNTVGVTSTSPGTDHITVRLLKACWAHLRDTLLGLYNRRLALCHLPRPWRLAEVAMLLK
jgi:hypothetical protein